MRGASRRAAPELPRQRGIDVLAVRSWMLPRVQQSARAKRKIGGRVRIANGTAGQTPAFSQANPLGSVGFGELLVRTAKCQTVRKNREGSNNRTPSRQGLLQKCPGRNGRVPRSHWGCKPAPRKTILGAKDAL